MKTPQELNELADRLEHVGVVSHADKEQAAHELRHMAQLRADLHEAAELLRGASPRHLDPNIRPNAWYDRRDSFLAKLNRT